LPYVSFEKRKVEDSKGVIRSRKLKKDKQYNAGQNKKEQRNKQ
jgi:hypothetical protein